MRYILFIVTPILLTLLAPLVAKASVPVWVTNFDKCTAFENSLESFQYNLHSTLLQKQLDTEASRELARVEKARNDVNRLVASVYDELRTTQINFPDENKKILQSIGIVATDPLEASSTNSEFCKASYEIQANFEGEGGKNQCVAVQQEARIITNIDDYIFEEPIRKASDFLFCYLGDWRHFPIDNINSEYNCSQLTDNKTCSIEDIIITLNLDSLNSDNKLDKFEKGEIGITEVCEAMRDKGKKCSADIMRDAVKYNTLSQISRKERTSTLMPPQTWYTPDRCKIIESVLPSCSKPNEEGACSLQPTPFTETIKTNNKTSSIYGDPSLNLIPDNDPNWSFNKVLESIYKPENNVSGLQEKTLNQAQKIINEYTELNKIQYQTGKGLRPATYIVGFKDYLDVPSYQTLMSNKINGDPLPKYWEGTPPENGQYFFFDTGIVISPTVFLLDKLQSAIQAQFDLARDTFAFIDSNKENPDKNPNNYPRLEQTSKDIANSCQLFTEEWLKPGPLDTNSLVLNPTIPEEELLPPPYYDEAIGLNLDVGTPLQNKITEDIGDFEQNYFTQFYNNVMQLYKTPFSEVLENWFKPFNNTDGSIFN